MKTIELGIRKIHKISKAHYINLPFIWMLHNNNVRHGDKLELSVPDGRVRLNLPRNNRTDSALIMSLLGFYLTLSSFYKGVNV